MSLYIIDYSGGRRTEHGPFTTVAFQSVNTTIPRICDDTVSYRTTKTPDDEYKTITVGMVHTIVPAELKDSM